jgi:hypothetical protein
MSLTTAGKNMALNAVSPTTMSLHTGAPGNLGANNEAAGDGYARKSCSLAAAAAGSRALSSTVSFDAGIATYTHVALWIGANCVDTSALNATKELTSVGVVDVNAGSVSLT